MANQLSPYQSFSINIPAKADIKAVLRIGLGTTAPFTGRASSNIKSLRIRVSVAGPIRHPTRPSPTVTSRPLGFPTHRIGLPMLRAPFPLHTCHRQYPGAAVAATTLPISRDDLSLPRIDWQVGPHITLFEACSAFTYVAACIFAKSPSDPLHRRLQPLRACTHQLVE
jgi:hypothetical protein